MPPAQRHRALRALESWIVRRALCRATSKDMNRMVVELLRAMDDAGAATAGDTVEKLLASQQADSRYWPDDVTLSAALREEPIYKNLSRPRLRMVLEAIEDSLRGPLGEGQRCPRNLTVEHVMPQAWREHWGADIADDTIAALRHDVVVHILGNLTLVGGRLNPTLSNRPWTSEQAKARGLGDHGKRDHLLKHSLLKLNAEMVAEHDDTWTEDDIRARGEAHIGSVTAIWPRPDTETGQRTARTLAAQLAASSVATLQEDKNEASYAGKYRPLWRWLQDQGQDDVKCSFTEVEQVLGMSLPPSARKHLPHWYGYDGTALGRAIRDAGWRASGVDLTAESVTFVRVDSHPSKLDETGEVPR